MAAVKTCRHLMPTGRTCKSPAMRGSAYCYYHGPQTAPRRAAAKPRPVEETLEFEPLADEAAVACMANRIVGALAENRISSGRAAVMLQGLQTALASWRILPPVDPEDDFDPEYNLAEALKARFEAHARAASAASTPEEAP